MYKRGHYSLITLVNCYQLVNPQPTTQLYQPYPLSLAVVPSVVVLKHNYKFLPSKGDR